MSSPGRAAHLLWLALLLVPAFAAGNLLRDACWTQTEGFVCGPGRGGTRELHAPIRVERLTSFEVAAPAWRPLAYAFQATADRASGAIAVSDRADRAGTPVPIGGAPVAVTVEADDRSPYAVRLWAEADPRGSPPVALRVLSVAPVPAAWPALAAIGAGAGLALVLVWGLSGRSSRPSETAERADAVAWLLPLLILVAVHGAWIVLKPPLQSPDEVQHHARATSIADTPYVGGAWNVPLTPTHRNPLTWTPNRLHAIITLPHERIRPSELDALRATPWSPAAPYPPVEHIPTGIVSYPPAYYWTVFTGGELLTWLFGLSPYASVLAYRGASVAAAAALWLAVHRQLLLDAAMRPWALPIFVVLIGIPTTASITSTVNPDAVAVPSTVLLFLTTRNALAGRAGIGAVGVAALLALIAKPSGLLATLAAAAGTCWWMWRRPADRATAWLVLRRLAAATALVIVVFYAWSPPRLTPVPSPPRLGAGDYLFSLVQRAPALWVEYWGRLGWLEYSAPTLAYWAMLGICAVLLIASLRRWNAGSAPASDGFLPLTACAYLVLLAAGEYANHHEAGLVMQGRYLLPLSVCLIPLVGQPARALRWLLPGALIALHVALAQATMTRYFEGGWSTWLRSLG